MAQKAAGWIVTVAPLSEVPGESHTDVYDVAIPDPDQAVDAVRKSTELSVRAIVSPKSQLSQRYLDLARLKPADIKLRNRFRKHRLPSQGRGR